MSYITIVAKFPETDEEITATGEEQAEVFENVTELPSSVNYSIGKTKVNRE